MSIVFDLNMGLISFFLNAFCKMKLMIDMLITSDRDSLIPPVSLFCSHSQRGLVCFLTEALVPPLPPSLFTHVVDCHINFSFDHCSINRSWKDSQQINRKQQVFSDVRRGDAVLSQVVVSVSFFCRVPVYSHTVVALFSHCFGVYACVVSGVYCSLIGLYLL